MGRKWPVDVERYEGSTTPAEVGDGVDCQLPLSL